MTIPEIRNALNELHERLHKSEQANMALQEDIAELRSQIDVQRFPQPVRTPEGYAPSPVNGIIGSSLCNSTSPQRY